MVLYSVAGLHTRCQNSRSYTFHASLRRSRVPAAFLEDSQHAYSREDGLRTEGVLKAPCEIVQRLQRSDGVVDDLTPQHSVDVARNALTSENPDRAVLKTDLVAHDMAGDRVPNEL